VLTVADRLGARDRMSHPEILDDAAFLYNEGLAQQRWPEYVIADVEYRVFISDEIVPCVTGPM
jgi:hypothetical protein